VNNREAIDGESGVAEVERRVVLITGAASGVGAALARRLPGPDIALVLHTRANRAGLDAVAAAARAAGAEVRSMLGDLAEPATATASIAEAADRFGRLDGLVHNAGFALAKPFGQLEQHELDHSGAVIRDAFFRLATAALPLLSASPRGRVVAVSSFVAHEFRLGGVVFAASAAAKAGLEALMKALAAQLAPRGVTVNAVVPGFVRKDPGAAKALDAETAARALERVPLARLGEPDEIAATIAFLLGPDAGYITGQAIRVDGGLSL
jgi:NAD(P)-dependent dehydrogenase (short-subunit alcohol dehydrogenase family)